MVGLAADGPPPQRRQREWAGKQQGKFTENAPLVGLAATTAHDIAAAPLPPETRVILAPRPRCAVVLDRHVQKSAGSTMRSIFLENALAGACL